MTAVRRSSQTDVPLRPVSGQEQRGPSMPLDVRAARLRDLLALHLIDQRIPLDLPNRQCEESDPAMVALRQVLPLARHDEPLLVAHAERRLVGYAHFQIVGPDRRWILQTVGSAMGIYEAEPIWEELLRYAVVTAGLDGTKRLYTRLPPAAPITGAARRTGFTPYVSETIWAAALVPVTRAVGHVRRQHQADVWSIHQLYMAVVPRQVQYAEALTSHSWDVTTPRLPGGAFCHGWLVEDGHLVAAYARVISHHNAHIIEVLVDPEQREVFNDLLSMVFAELGRMPARRVYVTLRGYQSELTEILRGFGFVLFQEQDVSIKYTTASAWTPAVSVSPFSVDVKEPSAKRVPTFLHGSHADPSSDAAGSQ